MEDDLYPTNYSSFEDMRGYCYKVASTVGLALIEIYGYENPDLENMLRKWEFSFRWSTGHTEDLEHGRVYLPRDEMSLLGYQGGPIRSQPAFHFELEGS